MGLLGNAETIYNQTEELLQRMQADSRRVQEQKRETCTMLNSGQFTALADFAIRHISENNDQPFDMSLFHQPKSDTDSIEFHISKFLEQCLQQNLPGEFWKATPINGPQRLSLGQNQSQLSLPESEDSQSLAYTQRVSTIYYRFNETMEFLASTILRNYLCGHSEGL